MKMTRKTQTITIFSTKTDVLLRLFLLSLLTQLSTGKIKLIAFMQLRTFLTSNSRRSEAQFGLVAAAREAVDTQHSAGKLKLIAFMLHSFALAN